MSMTESEGVLLKVSNVDSIRALVPESLLRNGAVHILDLDSIRVRAGVRWEKSRDAVYARLEQTLQRQLGSADVFLRLTDTTYLLTQPSSPPEDSDLCCFKIMFDLLTHLFGQCGVADICLHRVVACEQDALVTEKIAFPALHKLAVRAGTSVDVGGDVVSLPIQGAPAGTGATRFAPVWDARKGVITTFRQEIEMVEGFDSGIDPRRAVASFLLCFRRSCEMLARHAEGNARFLLEMPISYELLSNPIGRMEFVSLCRSLPSHVRQFLLFEVAQIPLGVPQSRLSELVSALKPFARGIFAQVTSRTYDFGAFQSVGLQAIGLSLVSPTGVVTGREEVEKLAAAAHKMRLSSFVCGAQSLDQIEFACSRGIDLVCGTAIGTPVREPAGMYRLDLAGIAASATLRRAG
jgi:hypothetical protein